MYIVEQNHMMMRMFVTFKQEWRGWEKPVSADGLEHVIVPAKWHDMNFIAFMEFWWLSNS